jgi:hypothetical protein
LKSLQSRPNAGFFILNLNKFLQGFFNISLF